MKTPEQACQSIIRAMSHTRRQAMQRVSMHPRFAHLEPTDRLEVARFIAIELDRLEREVASHVRAVRDGFNRWA